jgi:hypothetical protein
MVGKIALHNNLINTEIPLFIFTNHSTFLTKNHVQYPDM